jgi:hypothetical protein
MRWSIPGGEFAVRLVTRLTKSGVDQVVAIYREELSNQSGADFAVQATFGT